MSDAHARPHTGLVSHTGPRPTNEDAYFLHDAVSHEGPVLAWLGVADGMGGHESGEVAAGLAVAVATAALRSGADDADSLRRVFRKADAAIRARAGDHRAGRSMGTTLTVAVVHAADALIAHVGDSRAWLLRDGHLRQITRDHSRVGELLRAGAISEDEALGHPEGNVLRQALGVGRAPTVDIHRVRLAPSDVLMLSTDGLHDVLRRVDIEEVLTASTSLQEACQRLLMRSQQAGSGDNVTVVAWQYPVEARRTRAGAAVRRSAAAGPARGRPLDQSRSEARGQDLRWLLLAGGFAAGAILGSILRLSA